MKTTIEMAREAAGDDWGLFQEYMPEIHRLAALVRADERARMAEQPAQQEPVAYWIPKAEQFCIADPSGRPFAKAWEPLYTSPQPAQPLTDEQIEEKAARTLFPVAFARAIEAAHGIKENT